MQFADTTVAPQAGRRGTEPRQATEQVTAQSDAMILVAGSANLDFVVRADHIPAPGETVLGQDFRTFPGGKGANQAVASARAGAASTHMLLAVGADPFAGPLLDSLDQAGVVRHTVQCPDEPTGTAFICVSASGENAITVAPGANMALRPEHLPPLQGTHALLMQLETPLPTVLAFAQAARAAGVRVLLNAAPAPHNGLPEALLASIDVLVVNEGELSAIVGPGPVAEQLARLEVPCVVVTLGSEGCLAQLRQTADGKTASPQLLRQAGFAVEVQDTTAAGDTFCGVLAASLPPLGPLAAEPLTRALRRACAAAALACTRAGAQTSIPSADEVNQFLTLNP